MLSSVGAYGGSEAPVQQHQMVSTVKELLLFFLLLVVAGQGAHAQSTSDSAPFCEGEGRTATLDARGLQWVYCASSPALVRPLRWAHVSARPIFYGAVPLAWGGTLLLRRDDDYSDAYRLTATQGLTYGLVLGLKHAVGRPRPYVTRSLSSRSARYGASRGADAYTSFPSGHASLSAALVASWSLSHPKWYVWGPGSVWAVGVSLSRLHLGVHYPSDVLIGMGIGVGMAVLVHQLRGALTPEIVEGNGRALLRAPPPIGVQVRF
jgi:membrane-associated phospholipid phosphatase